MKNSFIALSLLISAFNMHAMEKQKIMAAASCTVVTAEESNTDQSGVFQNLFKQGSALVKFGTEMKDFVAPTKDIIVKVGIVMDQYATYYQKSMELALDRDQKMLTNEVMRSQAALEDSSARKIEAQARMGEVENNRQMIAILNSALQNQNNQNEKLMAALLNLLNKDKQKEV